MYFFVFVVFRTKIKKEEKRYVEIDFANFPSHLFQHKESICMSLTGPTVRSREGIINLVITMFPTKRIREPIGLSKGSLILYWNTGAACPKS